MSRSERFSRKSPVAPVPPGARWWRDPFLLARWTRRVSLLALFLFAAAAWSCWGEHWLPPIRTVIIEGEIGHSDPAVLRYAAGRVVEGRNFFDVDLGTLRRALEDTPWVSRAEARRVWPDTVVINLSEHRPVAFWIDVATGELSFLDANGRTFRASVVPEDDLPRLVGPAGREEVLLEAWAGFSQVLRPVGHLSTIEMGPSLSWIARIDGGPEIILGRVESVQMATRRLAWLAHRWDAIRERAGFSPVRVDFRHDRALALASPASAPVPPALPKGKRRA